MLHDMSRQPNNSNISVGHAQKKKEERMLRMCMSQIVKFITTYSTIQASRKRTPHFKNFICYYR